MPTTHQPIRFREAIYLTSATTLAEAPQDDALEVAFAGRSNAGKSSAINALTDNKRLARTSKTPGRTQMINFFSLSETQRLVDLPGYGFAKVPLAVKEHWQRHLEDYLRRRRNLRALILLMDIRHPLQAFDRNMLDWATHSELPVHILLTKSDKLSRGGAKSALQQVRNALKGHPGVTAQTFSALNGEGLEELQTRLSDWLQDDEPVEPAPPEGDAVTSPPN